MNNGSFGNMLYGEIEREIIDLTKESEEIIIEPSIEERVYLPSENKQFSKVTTKGVTAEIDENIKPENIKLGATILGVQGNVAPDKPDQEKTIYPSEEEQIVTADLGYELGKVISKPIQTETIEVLPTKEKQTINASDGKYIKQFEVLGVETEELNIIPTTEAQIFTPSDNKFFDKVNVGAVENIDTELTDQEELLTELETQVNELSDKPKDMLQQMVDSVNSCAYLFYKYLGTEIDFIDKLDTSNVTDMSSMFYDCTNITSLDLSLDTNKVTTMQTMFNNCAKLKTLNLSRLNTNNLRLMINMFAACSKLEEIIGLEDLDVSSVTDMSFCFQDCKSLTSLDLSKWNTKSLSGASLKSTFSKCEAFTTLNLSGWNVSNVTDIQNLVGGCKNLTSVNLTGWDTSNVTMMYGVFSGCSKIDNLDFSNLNTEKVKNMSYMFASCTALTTVTNLNMVGATNINQIFDNCKNITNVTLKNIKVNLKVGSGSGTGYYDYGAKLTNESLIAIIQELWDLTGATSQTLTMTTTSKENIANIYVKLVDVTDEMLAQDQYAGNKKPCVVCESTDEGAMTLTEYAISKNWSIA